MNLIKPRAPCAWPNKIKALITANTQVKKKRNKKHCQQAKISEMIVFGIELFPSKIGLFCEWKHTSQDEGPTNEKKKKIPS